MRILRNLLFPLLFCFFAGSVYAEPVDINRADAATIAETMVGVGIKKAEAIVAYRDAHGAFKSLDELAQVKGIGEATLEKNRDKVHFGDSK